MGYSNTLSFFGNIHWRIFRLMEKVITIVIPVGFLTLRDYERSQKDHYTSQLTKKNERFSF